MRGRSVGCAPWEGAAGNNARLVGEGAKMADCPGYLGLPMTPSARPHHLSRRLVAHTRPWHVHLPDRGANRQATARHDRVPPLPSRSAAQRVLGVLMQPPGSLWPSSGSSGSCCVRGRRRQWGRPTRDRQSDIRPAGRFGRLRVHPSHKWPPTHTHQKPIQTCSSASTVSPGLIGPRLPPRAPRTARQPIMGPSMLAISTLLCLSAQERPPLPLQQWAGRPARQSVQSISPSAPVRAFAPA